MKSDWPVSPSRRQILRHAGAGAVLLAAAPFKLLSTAHAADRTVIATTRSGKIRGRIEQGVHVFKGIPYGADTSTRRFRPALPPIAWKGVRDALTYAPACPQPGISEPTS
jgi:para-nitrobenzyl esterase